MPLVKEHSQALCFARNVAEHCKIGLNRLV